MSNQLRIKRSATTAIGSVGTVAFGELIYTENDDALYIADSTNTPVQIGKKISGNSSEFLRGDGVFATPAGGGDVSGPASATDNAVVRFDSTTGKLIQNSVVTIADTTGNMAGVGTLNTHTIPAGTDVFTLNDATQTLTAKTLTGATISTSTINLSGSVSPTPTAEGRIEWDTDDDAIKVGDGVGTKTFSDDTVVQNRANHTGTQTAATISDFTTAVQAVTEVANAVQTDDTDVSAWSFTETNVTNNTSTKFPTAAAVKTYVDNAVASEMTYKGGYDASTNSPDLDTSPSGVAIGDMYTVTVAGTFFTTAVEVGDVLIAESNNASTEADWTIVNKNLDGVASSGITLTAGIGLVGGGDLSANRTFDLNFNELTAQTAGATTDEIAVQLTGNGAFRKMTVANFLDGGTF